jgi:hypothetical protein
MILEVDWYRLLPDQVISDLLFLVVTDDLTRRERLIDTCT